MTTEQQNLADFAKTETQRLEDQRAKEMKDKGLTPFYKVTVGEHILTILTHPVPNPKYENRVMFQVMDPKSTEWTLSITKDGPLYRDVMKALVKSSKLKIIRVGKKQDDTRYSVESI